MAPEAEASVRLFLSEGLVDDTVGRGVQARVGDRIQPTAELAVQIVEVAKDAAEEEVLPDIAERPFDLAIIRYEGISASTLVRSSGRGYGETIRVLGRWKHESAGRPT
jgi:hypothetical protein